MENTGEQAPFVPFTKAERIQQLGEIDRGIVSLLRSAGAAIQTLGTQQAQGEDTIMTEDKGQQSQVFQDSLNEFLRTLRTVNVGMKRQIWGLEEAHIISLDKESQNVRDEGGESQGASHRNAPLKPDGDGKIGGLDVGWLNSRSDKVERDMEADLWKEAELYLRRLIEQNDAAADSITVASHVQTYL
ncbi:mediator complex protein-domain-containing protein [Hypoxylon trugodes]|uniref:mediator complex protein-domain-containing protein n=1 Tax=Hypoxylon trugodes TaxID=326681 RepID=UPI00219FE2AD|nr:mediator complex protein-domain-containing protein [Hypoxylon trugodes]KAI1390519.1 mediator complex protein-domain-containing protein [Hypoxylon trugodes]